MVYEIEFKAVLTEEQYSGLLERLTSDFEMFNEDTIHTTRYRPGDVRFRISDKICELVQKEGDPTKICRWEHIYPIKDRTRFEPMQEELRKKEYEPDPPWVKHKREFYYSYKGFKYIVCLQDIKDFAKILEVEYMSETPDLETHEPNIRAILKELGVEVIEPAEFLKRIQEYIEANKS